MLNALLFLAGGLVLLMVAAELLVKGSSSIAERLGVSSLVIGLTVVAFGTSAPELVASLKAAYDGSTGMAIGNIIGSNISNIALVLGVAALINPLKIDRKIARIDGPIALGASALLVLFLYDGSLARWEGGVLATAMVLYLGYLFKNPGVHDEEEAEANEEAMAIPAAVGLSLLGLLGLVGGAWLFVEGAQDLAALAGVSEAVIGLTVMAIGTSLPEIATVIAASRRGMSDLVTGNCVGSNIFNVLSVLGITALIFPLEMQGVTTIDLMVFIVSAILVQFMMVTRGRLSRIEGLLLIIGFFGYVWYLY